MSELVRLHLTAAQARGLLALAEAGELDLLSDREQAAAYIGPPPSQRAAKRAIAALRGGLYSDVPDGVANH